MSTMFNLWVSMLQAKPLLYLDFKQLQAVPLSARKVTGGNSEGIASFLQLPHVSKTIVKIIGRKVIKYGWLLIL